MIISIIGPSGVGKTTVSDILRDDFGYTVYNLDAMAYLQCLAAPESLVNGLVEMYQELGADTFFKSSIELIEATGMADDENIIFLDTGVGFFQASYGLSFLEKTISILLISDSSVAWRRYSGRESSVGQERDDYVRSFEDLVGTLSGRVDHRIDVTNQNPADTVATVNKFLINRGFIKN